MDAAYALTVFLMVVMLAQSALGCCFAVGPAMPRSIAATWLGNDWVTLLVPLHVPERRTCAGEARISDGWACSDTQKTPTTPLLCLTLYLAAALVAAIN